MHTYNLTATDTQTEKDIIQQILINNKYDPNPIQDSKKKKKENLQKQDTERTKWANLPILVKKQDLSARYLGNQTSNSHSPQIIP